MGFRFKDNILGRNGLPDNGGNEVIGQKPGKGVMACSIACLIFEDLTRAGVPNHFVDGLSDDSVRVRKTDPIRLEFIARNLAYGSYLRQNPKVRPLTALECVRDITLKDDGLDDPLMSANEAVSRKIIHVDEVPVALELLGRVTDVLTRFYASRNLRLGDLKMEVGRSTERSNPQMMVIDDLGYDNTRVFREDRLLDIEELHAALAR